MPNFCEIYLSTADIKLLPVLGHGRQPYTNSDSGFDFDVCAVSGISFSACLPNFAVGLIERSAVEL